MIRNPTPNYTQPASMNNPGTLTLYQPPSAMQVHDQTSNIPSNDQMEDASDVEDNFYMTNLSETDPGTQAPPPEQQVAVTHPADHQQVQYVDHAQFDQNTQQQQQQQEVHL
jgi:hypothetical protein